MLKLYAQSSRSPVTVLFDLSLSLSLSLSLARSLARFTVQCCGQFTLASELTQAQLVLVSGIEGRKSGVGIPPESLSWIPLCPYPSLSRLSHTHTRTCAHTHARSRTHTNTHTRSRTHTNTYAHSRSRTHTNTHTHAHDTNAHNPTPAYHALSLSSP